MRKFQSCNFSSVGCSAPGPCSLEKAESIYSKLREMCYHSMFIYLFPFRLEKLFDQGEYSFALFYVYIISWGFSLERIFKGHQVGPDRNVF